jgi:hypothetical protein
MGSSLMRCVPGDLSVEGHFLALAAPAWMTKRAQRLAETSWFLVWLPLATGTMKARMRYLATNVAFLVARSNSK